MSDIKEAMRLIGGVAPSPEQVRRVQSIAHSLGIPNNDPLMMQYVALDCYFGVFSELPEKINKVVNDSVKTAERAADLVVTDASRKVQSVVAGNLAPLASVAFAEGVRKYIDRLENEAANSAQIRAMPIALGAVAIAVLVGLGIGWGGGTWARSASDEKLITAAAASQAAVSGQLEKKDLTTVAAIADMKSETDSKIAEIKADSKKTIENLSAAKTWYTTPEGQLAYKFFTAGGGNTAAKCEGINWEIRNVAAGKFCVPRVDGIFGWKDGSVGWKIP